MTQTPTDALRLVPVDALPDEIDLFRIIRAAGRSNREKAFAVSSHLQALAAAPASPLPGGGERYRLGKYIENPTAPYPGGLDQFHDDIAFLIEIPAAPTGDAARPIISVSPPQ